MNLSIKPKKTLGQHFLINPRILDKIVAAAEISKEDIILEVGPGTGNLTQKLADKAGKVIAVEKDRRLIAQLKETFRNNRNVEIIEGDILKLDVSSFKFQVSNYKIVANIPYYITSRFLRKVFEEWPKPKLIILTIQKEVAQRITAKPPHMNLLAVSVQFFAEPKIVSYISKGNFRPRPKVDSAIIKLIPKESLPAVDYKNFFKIVQAGFSQKRKQLKNNLQKIFGPQTTEILNKAKIPLKTRAEELLLSDWIKIIELAPK